MTILYIKMHFYLVVMLYLNEKNKNCELAGLPQIRLHDFRHSCASLLINSGANVTVGAKYLGHTKIEETLNTYTHLFSSAMNEVVNLIDKLNTKKARITPSFLYCIVFLIYFF